MLPAVKSVSVNFVSERLTRWILITQAHIHLHTWLACSKPRTLIAIGSAAFVFVQASGQVAFAEGLLLGLRSCQAHLFLLVIS